MSITVDQENIAFSTMNSYIQNKPAATSFVSIMTDDTGVTDTRFSKYGVTLSSDNELIFDKTLPTLDMFEFSFNYKVFFVCYTPPDDFIEIGGSAGLEGLEHSKSSIIIPFKYSSSIINFRSISKLPSFASIPAEWELTLSFFRTNETKTLNLSSFTEFASRLGTKVPSSVVLLSDLGLPIEPSENTSINVTPVDDQLIFEIDMQQESTMRIL